MLGNFFLAILQILSLAADSKPALNCIFASNFELHFFPFFQFDRCFFSNETSFSRKNGYISIGVALETGSHKFFDNMDLTLLVSLLIQAFTGRSTFVFNFRLLLLLPSFGNFFPLKLFLQFCLQSFIIFY